MVAAGTKRQGNVADKPDGSQKAKTAGVKAERNHRYENNECFVCVKQGHKQRDCPQSQQSKAGRGVRGQSHGQDPQQQQHQQQQQQHSTSGPAQHTPGKATGMGPASATPTAGASGYKTTSKAVVTGTEPAAPTASTQKDDDYVSIRMLREKVAPVDVELTETVQHNVSHSEKNAEAVLQSVPVLSLIHI